jgi:hypothetical protein
LIRLRTTGKSILRGGVTNFKRRLGRLEKESTDVLEVTGFRLVASMFRSPRDGQENQRDGEEGCNPYAGSDLLGFFAPQGQENQRDGVLGCKRWIAGNLLWEVVNMYGAQDSVSEDEIDRLLQNTPIEGLKPNQKIRIRYLAH